MAILIGDRALRSGILGVVRVVDRRRSAFDRRSVLDPATVEVLLRERVLRSRTNAIARLERPCDARIALVPVEGVLRIVTEQGIREAQVRQRGGTAVRHDELVDDGVTRCREGLIRLNLLRQRDLRVPLDQDRLGVLIRHRRGRTSRTGGISGILDVRRSTDGVADIHDRASIDIGLSERVHTRQGHGFTRCENALGRGIGPVIGELLESGESVDDLHVRERHVARVRRDQRVRDGVTRNGILFGRTENTRFGEFDGCGRIHGGHLCRVVGHGILRCGVLRVFGVEHRRRSALNGRRVLHEAVVDVLLRQRQRRRRRDLFARGESALRGRTRPVVLEAGETLERVGDLDAGERHVADVGGREPVFDRVPDLGHVTRGIQVGVLDELDAGIVDHMLGRRWLRHDGVTSARGRRGSRSRVRERRGLRVGVDLHRVGDFNLFADRQVSRPGGDAVGEAQPGCRLTVDRRNRVSGERGVLEHAVQVIGNGHIGERRLARVGSTHGVTHLGTRVDAFPARGVRRLGELEAGLIHWVRHLGRGGRDRSTARRCRLAGNAVRQRCTGSICADDEGECKSQRLPDGEVAGPGEHPLGELCVGSGR